MLGGAGEPTARRGLHYLLQVVALGIVYAGAGKAGLKLDAVSGFATLVWPPTGISLAALLLFGHRLWPGIYLGAVLANLWSGAAVPVAVAIGLGNTLEAVAGAWALRALRVRTSLDRLRDAVALIGTAAMASTLVSATIGVTSVRFAGLVSPDHVLETWRAWWLGDVLGDLVVAPLLLTWGSAPPVTPPRRRAAEAAEAAALGLSTLALGSFVFLGGSLAEFSPVRQAYMILPLVMWAALRFGPRGATTTSFVLSVIAIAGTALGSGPFVRETLVQSLVFLQVFMAVAAITGLVLGAVVSERSVALQKREELLAIVSHDLRNPLAAIRVSAHTVLKHLPPEAGERLGQQLALIHRSTERMDGLIRDLLDLSAIEAGHLSVELKRESATDLVRDAIEAMRPVAAQRSLSLSARLPDDAISVHCDRERIAQVFSNLIGNAIKFSPAGATILLGARGAEGEARLWVTDTGPGIRAEQLQRIFDPFQQAGPRVAQGIGLGLAIARGIVEAQGGRIWAESNAGRGTTFCFTLPLATDRTADASQGKPV